MCDLSAVVLAAGEGKRLRPLTRHRPKPMLPAATTPILERVLDELLGAGVTDITLVVGYGRERVQSYFGPTYRNVPLTYVGQAKQLGTGHALEAAAEATDGPLLVLNGDQIVDRTIVGDVVDAHAGSDAVATLGLLPTHDASEYGGVRLERDPALTGDGRIVDLVEQPPAASEFRLNAGVYAFEREIFDAIAATDPSDGERSLIDAISRLVAADDALVQGVETDGLWVDATYPWDLLDVAVELFDREAEANDPPRAVSDLASVHETAVIRGPVVIDDHCEIGPGAVVGPYAALGENVTVGAGAIITRSVLDADVRVGPNATLRECVAGQGVVIGGGSTIPGGPADVRVGDRVFEDEPLGALLADRVTDDGAATYVPGTIVGPDAHVSAGATVRGTVPDGTEVRS